MLKQRIITALLRQFIDDQAVVGHQFYAGKLVLGISRGPALCLLGSATRHADRQPIPEFPDHRGNKQRNQPNQVNQVIHGHIQQSGFRRCWFRHSAWRGRRLGLLGDFTDFTRIR